MAEEREYLFDKPQNVRRVIWLLYGICGLLLVLELFVHRHLKHPWEGLPGFYPLYGFVGCVLLVLIAKWMRRLIIRPENYYAQRDFPQHPSSAGDPEQ